VEDSTTIHAHQNHTDNIDLNKFRMIVRNNWFWMVLLFLITNSAAYLYIRYTQDLFESVSELKLDIKQDASELGLGGFLPDRQKVNLISGEIETIQSKSFLSQIIDSLNLHVSYYSIGQFLNTELYTSSPFRVNFSLTQPSYYNTPITILPQDNNQYTLRIGKTGRTVNGTFNDTLSLEGLTLMISRKPENEFYPENTYSFVINSRDALLAYISANLTVEPLKFEANTIRISFKDNNPFKARDLVNGIDSVYLAFSHEQKNMTNKQKIDWLTAELKNIESQMESYESYFEDFTLKNRTSNLEGDLKKTIDLITKIDSQRFELNRRINEANQLIDALSNREFIVPVSQRSFFPDYLNKNIERLQDLHLDMDKMMLSYNENTFAYRQKQNEIESLRNKAFTQLSDLKAGWLKKQQELNQSRNKLESDFAAMPDKNTQYSKKQRFYKLYEEFYLTLMQNRSQFEIAQAGSTPDFKILSTANLPAKPISPNKPVIFGIGMVAGIVLNIFLVGILYLTNNKINSLYEVERLNHSPLLGVVPALPHTSHEPLYIISHPRSRVSEAIRTLRTNLDYFKTGLTQKIIAISSTVSGEGKSFIAMNLGGVIALSKKKVVLLDLDMRKKKNNSYFTGIDHTKGMSTILIHKNSWEECVTKSALENFDFIPAGPHPPNPSELLMNGAFNQLLHDLKKHYDYILMDTPPVGVVTDGIMAMKQADISIYIFRANYSKKEFINNLQRIVRVNKFQHITTILNALPTAGESAYGYGYYEEEKKSWARSIFTRSV
jgi:tyrosine-protein kinase Etk/Wzc